MEIKAFITGISGLELTSEEREFIRRENPWGFIVFARNIDSAGQLLALTNALRDCVGREDAPVLIDQEGGRVRRLRPPNWPHYGAGRMFGTLYETDREAGLRLAWLQSRLMALDMAACGINVDCVPVLDVPVAGAHDIIGDRAYSHEPYVVAQIARAAANGLLEGGVLPVIKHIPGHGRASADSHLELPVVDTHPAILGCTDFYPFMQLADLPLAMTAHVIYSGFDAEAPATTSRKMVQEIIRGWIGYDGLLMSDDVSMQALSGDFATRTQSCFAAGCDVVLHCNGDLAEMQAVAANSPVLEGKAAWRARTALERIVKPAECDEEALRAEYGELTGALVA